MNQSYAFILECGTAATIIRVASEDLLRAYVAVSIWINSKPESIEGLNYTLYKYQGSPRRQGPDRYFNGGTKQPHA